MFEHEIITFDHLDLSVLLSMDEKTIYKNFIFKRVKEFERNIALLNNFDDKNEYMRLFCLIENRRNEMQENINGFDFELWIKEYEDNS